jgi:RND family efflux transporter MFP subunit
LQYLSLEQASAQRNIAKQQLALLEEGARRQERSVSSQAVVAAEASVRQAESGVAAAKASLRQVMVREADFRASSAAIASAKAIVVDADVSIDDSSIRAPFAGRVAKRLVDPGMMATVGTPVLELDGGRQTFDTDVPEAAIQQLNVGSKVRIMLASYKSTPIVGTVSRITPQATASTHSYKVRITLPDAPTLISGLYGIAQLNLAKRRTILVDESAVKRRNGLAYIYVVSTDRTIQSRVVTLGTAINGRFPVESGLTSGDVIVREGVAGLADGVHVSGGSQ